MCKCGKNVEVGNYKNQVILKTPKHMMNLGTVGCYEFRENTCIDRCLEDEIKYLWSLGIRTTGCCCGHNKHIGYIGVVFEDIPRMKEIGYEVAFNSSRPNDEDSFIPKSVIYNLEQ